MLTEMEKSEHWSLKGIRSRVENYFIDSLLYQDSLEIDENLQPEELDSGNEAVGPKAHHSSFDDDQLM